METEEAVSNSIAISKSFDSIATKLFEQLKDYRLAGQITYEQYRSYMNNYYLPLMGYASRMLLDTSVAITEDLNERLKDIKKSTDNLKEVSAKIDKANQVFTVVTYVLSAAASTVSFIAAPTPFTFVAAASTIAGAVSSIEDLTKEKEE